MSNLKTLILRSALFLISFQSRSFLSYSNLNKFVFFYLLNPKYNPEQMPNSRLYCQSIYKKFICEFEYYISIYQISHMLQVHDLQGC